MNFALAVHAVKFVPTKWIGSNLRTGKAWPFLAPFPAKRNARRPARSQTPRRERPARVLAREAGVKTLNMLKAISAYMDPEYLVSESTFVQKQFQQGKIALTNLWASRAGALEDPAESKVVGKVGVGPAPAAVAGGKPATTIWWDGVTIAKNITDDEADAAFRLVMQGLSEDMVKANNDAAVWLIKGYKPGALAAGAFASAEAGAPPYPASPALGILHESFGNHVGDFLTGKKSAEQTLADIEAEYTTGAKEKGLIK